MGMIVRPRDANPSVYTGVDCESAKDGRTKQSFKDDTDINSIIARFERTGMVESMNFRQPFYGDVSGLVGYKESLETVLKAEALFSDLAAPIRERFDNDPAGLIEFLNDPANLDEAVKLGIAVKRPVAAVVPPLAASGEPTPK